MADVQTPPLPWHLELYEWPPELRGLLGSKQSNELHIGEGIPIWWRAGKTHDWRNHVGSEIQALWHTFTPDQQIAIYLDANERASTEHWD